MKNLGWLFYRTYFDLGSLQKTINNVQQQNEYDVVEETIEKFFKERNETFFKEKFEPNEWLKVVPDDDEHRFKLTTTYPGLLSGSGVSHETGKLNELKLGFSFDHTTGLPYLPGSTVKGAIRQAFPNHLRKKAVRVKDLKEREKLLRKADELDVYCIFLFKEYLKIDITTRQLLEFEWLVFEGKKVENKNEIMVEYAIFFQKMVESSLGVYESDIFYDACVSESLHEKKLFLGNDFITPHRNPLKNPIPIQFLKVLPNVVWSFQFDLKNTKLSDSITISAAQKLALFQTIIKDLGIGAKTNVGYGRLK